MKTFNGLLALLLPICAVAHAQPYPSRHIEFELVSPAGAGGGSGLVARNMYEDAYLNAGELAKWLAAQQVEVTPFLMAMGLVLKK